MQKTRSSKSSGRSSSEQKTGKRITDIDRHIGERIRAGRFLRKKSQVLIAKAMGITFQQVQKYENGANRIGAGRLWELSIFLDLPVSFFFEELTRTGVPTTKSELQALIPDKQAMNLATRFAKLRSNKTRGAIAMMVESMIEIEGA